MMVKGFIFFRDGKIPFVIENYHMELFTDDPLLDDFCKEYNFKENYILHGQCFDIGIRGRKATFLVENSMGSTCYLRCYTINMFDKDEEYDSIGLQSPSLDEVFRYEYEYIDMVRAGINLAIEPKVVYKVPFGMNDQKYELEFRIGHDNRLGLLEDLDRKCELILPLHTNEIQECYDITNVLHRLAMFMTSNAEVPFKRITLYKQWNEVPNSHQVKDRADKLKRAGLWQKVRDRYLEKKNMYLSWQDHNHPSFAVYVEAVNEVYNRYFNRGGGYSVQSIF